MKGFYDKGFGSPTKIERDALEREKKTSFATLNRSMPGINITYSGAQHEGGKLGRRGSGGKEGTPVKSRGFSPSGVEHEDIGLQLNTVKLKLEERRRKIEEEKRKMEMLMSKQREKVGQEAFLRAVSKGIRRAGGGADVPRNARDEILEIASKVGEGIVDRKSVREGGRTDEGLREEGRTAEGLKRPFSLKLNEEFNKSSVQTPEVEAMDISRMSDSLYSLQSDIQRLALQQTQIQNLMNTAAETKTMNPSGGNQRPFYINESSTTPPSNHASSTPPPSSHTPSKPFFINQPEQGSGNKPFYISQTSSPRRTWGEPAPMKLPPAAEYPAPQFQPPQLPHPQPYSHMQPPTQQPYGAPPPGYNQPYPYPPQPYYDQYGRPVGAPYPGGAYPSFPPGYTQPYPSYPTYHQPPYTPPDVHHPPQIDEEERGRLSLSRTSSLKGTTRYSLNQSLPLHSDHQELSAFNRSAPDRVFSAPEQRVLPSQERDQTAPERILSAPGRGISTPERVFSTPERALSTPERASLTPERAVFTPERFQPTQLAGVRSELEHDLRGDLRSETELTKVEERMKPATAEKPSLSASFLEQKRRNADHLEARPKSAILDRSGAILFSPAQLNSREQFPGARGQSPAARGYSPGARGHSPGVRGALLFDKHEDLDTTDKGVEQEARAAEDLTGRSLDLPIEPEMTASTLETLNKMKTETIGDTTDNAKGFLISFDNSAVKPKPILKPRKPVKKDDIHESPTVELINHGKEGSVTSDKMERNMDDIPTKMADYSPSGAILKCRLCEESESNDPSLQLCWSCIQLLKRNPRSPVCSRDSSCPSACDSCLLEKGRQLELIQKIEVVDIPVVESEEARQANITEKKEEWVQMMTLRRKQQAEESRLKREDEARKRREEEETKKEETTKRKEEERRRREEILEQHKIKKELSKDEAAGAGCPSSYNKFPPKLRPRSAGAGKPRPKTIHVDTEELVPSRTGLRGSQSNLNMSSVNRNRYHGSLRRGSNVSLHDDDVYAGSLRGLGHMGRSKSSSVSNLGPGSLPLGLRHSRGGREFDDGASDISLSSTTSGYRSGRVSARLFREPVSKSNRPIIMNAVEYVVFPGVVNKELRMRVLEEIERCDCPHFLILFRDSRLQFRGLYAFYPDTEEVFKIYGTGPKQINDNMMELYYKYNSGGKKFTQIHTKHLTVTIDGFTIHNSLWMGKKTKLPDKKDLALVL